MRSAHGSPRREGRGASRVAGAGGPLPQDTRPVPLRTGVPRRLATKNRMTFTSVVSEREGGRARDTGEPHAEARSRDRAYRRIRCAATWRCSFHTFPDPLVFDPDRPTSWAASAQPLHRLRVRSIVIA